MMVLDSQQAKLFIKVDGVIGDRRRICTFCNSTIHGAEKVVETTRKLRRAPYFPQLAHLQSSVGKIDTMGRAVVCLQCFHELLRQWNTYEMKNIPMSSRTYKHVSDKGVKNYQETRAKEIRAQAEKRAFAIQTNQDYIVKKAFDGLTKRLDAQEGIIQQSEECIERLKLKLDFSTTGEHWKINREIKKHQKIIAAAEAQIEDEEDKEELIRKETTSLLEVYRNNQSLFHAVSEPSLYQSDLKGTKERPITFEGDTGGLKKHVKGSHSEFDSDTKMNRSENFREYEYDYDDNDGCAVTVVKAMRIIQSDDNDEAENYCPQTPPQGDGRDVWSSLEPSSRHMRKEPENNNSDRHMTREIIHPSQSNEVQSFPEDEWSKLFDKGENDYENECDSENIASATVSWNLPTSNSPGDTEWRQIKSDFVEREEQQWSETVNTNDSDDEREQVYEVNSEYNDPHFRSHISDSLISGSHGVGGSHSSPSNKSEDVAMNQLSLKQQTKHEYDVSNYADVDPWDMIQIEKERSKIAMDAATNWEGALLASSHDKGGRSTTHYDLDYDENEYYEDGQDDYLDEEDQENLERDDKEVLSPRRLHPDRFSQFTKSSYIPEPAIIEGPSRQQSRDGKMKSSCQYNGNDVFEKENGIRSAESSNYVSNERTRNDEEKYHTSYDPLEPLRKNRNVDRHLSAEEAEWERKHLSPKRLDETRLSGFVKELNTEKPKSPIHYNIQEQTSRLSETPSDARLSPTLERLSGINVERSPALRKLMKQDEISEPVQRTTARTSVQSSPWDGLESETTRKDPGMRNEQDNETVGNERYVGKIDLKQWSSEIERNRNSFEPLNTYSEDKIRSPPPLKKNSMRSTQDAQKDEVVIINRNQSPKKAGDVYILDSKNEGTSQERTARPGSLKYKERINFSVEKDNSPNRRTPTTPTRMQHMVVIKDEQHTKHNDDDYLSRKNVGKVDLNIWEQNSSSLYYSSGSTAKVKSPESISPKDSLQFDNDKSRQYINKADTYKQKPAQSNSPKEDGSRANHRSFNKSMSEDELAWEKRYSKTYEIEIPADDPEKETVTQRKVSDQRLPRLDDDNHNLDENHNYFNFGKISLDEEEVRRVRGNKSNIENKIDERNEDVYITPKLRTDLNNKVQIHQSSNSPNPDQNKYGGDSSQLSEEERAWEEKTGRPGRLDFSKFSQFK